MQQPDEILRRIIDPEGRIVTLTQDAWDDHILVEHPELADYQWLVAKTISHPLYSEPDVRPERVRYYTQGEGPSSYFCVVVEYVDEGGDVITAFGHREER
jgi:hypothetical protein